jgi:hypothetical protein
MRDKRTDSAASGHSRAQQPAGEAERRLRARLAAHAMHARHDARLTTANGRAAFLARFEREVDPDGALEPGERQRRAAHARRLYFSRLSLAAVKARRTARRRQDGQAHGGGAA